MTRRSTGLWAAVLLCAAAAVVGLSVVPPEDPGALRPAWIQDQTAPVPEPVLDAPSGRRGPAPAAAATARPTPSAPTSMPPEGAAGPAGPSEPERRTPTVLLPYEPGDETGAGPPVSYTDHADDAYGSVGSAALSQPSFDILRVGWSPASHVAEHRRGYATSMTIAGKARDDTYYVSYGEFYSDVPGETCQLYHLLVPGHAAFANAICGSTADGSRRLVGEMHGSQVTVTSTSEGTVLVATFDDAQLPAHVVEGRRMLWRLSALTCLRGTPNVLACGHEDTRDRATSTTDYRL